MKCVTDADHATELRFAANVDDPVPAQPVVARIYALLNAPHNLGPISPSDTKEEESRKDDELGKNFGAYVRLLLVYYEDVNKKKRGSEIHPVSFIYIGGLKYTRRLHQVPVHTNIKRDAIVFCWERVYMFDISRADASLAE